MTMDAMVAYLEKRGFEATREYESDIRKYRFTISKNGTTLSMLFEYPAFSNVVVKDKKQREFLETMVDRFNKKFDEPESLYPKMMMALMESSKLPKLLSIADMRDILVRNGCAVETWGECNDVGKHEEHFRVFRNGRTLHRVLYEYGLGGLSEIQEHRRYFLKEIIEAFEQEERREKERKSDFRTHYMGRWNMRLSDLEPKKVWVTTAGTRPSTALEEVIMKHIKEWFKEKEKEKEMNNNIMIDTRAFAKALYPSAPSAKLPTIKKVIFNDPATIVIWADETKTVVKAQNDEPFDPEKGLAMAITKKALGNEGNYFDTIKKWVGECRGYVAAKEATIDIEHSAKWNAAQRLHNALGDKKATKEDLRIAMNEAIGYLGETLE